MNNSRKVWGIVLLALALLLLVINIAAPGDVVFHIGQTNVPWVPIIALAIIGVVLLGAPQRAAEDKPDVAPKPQPVKDPVKTAENKRLESIAWGLFLVMLGGSLLVPESQVKSGVWSIGMGLIFLGLNYARYRNSIKMSGFTTVLGIISLVGGIVQLVTTADIGGAILIIILGVYLILKPRFEGQKLFGKAEES
jgi:hypothetical protein